VTELPPPFEWTARAGLGDVAPSGRVRLDTLLRWLQDAAQANVASLGFADELWVVRRTVLTVQRFPVYGEPVIVATRPAGLARLWAQRETTVCGEAGACVRAVAVWVHLDATGRPRPLDTDYAAALAVYGKPTVKPRLTHPPPADGAAQRPWAFRAADLDMAAHVNNAVYWAVLEEELGDWPAGAPLRVEVEHPAAADAGPASVLVDGDLRWIVDGEGKVVASLRVNRCGAPS
jgi:acyl-ACP thioesterase